MQVVQRAQPQTFGNQQVLKLLFIAALFVLGTVLILEVNFVSDYLAELTVGDIAPIDIVAPRQIYYQSEIATEAARKQAQSRVSPIYTRPDPSVAQQQVETVNLIFEYIDAIRADSDPSMTAEMKLDWLGAIKPVSIDPETAAIVLSMNDPLWNDVKQDVRNILQAVMRTEIRDSQLSATRRRLGLYISPDIPNDAADVILALTEELIQPNTHIDEALTEEAQLTARDAVEPVYKTVEQNEVVVRAGERITAEQIETMQAAGLQRSNTRLQSIVASSLWAIFVVILFSVYLIKRRPEHLHQTGQLLGLTIAVLLFELAGRFMMQPDSPLAYALPTAALAIVVAVLFASDLALVVNVLLGLVLAYMSQGSWEIFVYVFTSGFIISLLLGPMAQLNNFLWAGVYTVVSNVAILLLFRLIDGSFEWMMLLGEMGYGLLNGVLSAGLALIAFFIIGNTTDIVTYIQLLDLSRPTHPLLTELLRRAPGTYHHSLLVSNLAEQAAQRIGANAFLCRIGAYYHDVGKMLRPYFFTENIPPGADNLHNNLDPETSAQIIVSHVTDGLTLAKKYHLPKIIHDFIAEHHGTEVPGYFYQQALKSVDGDESQLDRSRFAYPGPKPQSRETAILMLADASEATVRAMQPQSIEEIDQIVRRSISNRLKSGQLDECDLTMRDLEQIRFAFNDVLQGVSHPRVKYPQDIKDDKIPDTGSLPPLPLAMQSALSERDDDNLPPQLPNDSRPIPIPRE